MLTATIPLASRARPRGRRLRGFVLLSITLHIAALVIAVKQPIQPNITLGQSMLSVRLETQRSPVNAHVLQHKPVSTEKSPSWPVQPPTPAVTTAGSGETDKSTISRVALQNYLLGALNTELARYLSYPAFARERGWQGTVLIGVGVGPGGLLYNLRLIKSSGFSLLDQTTLTSLRKIKALPLTTAFEWGDPVEVILPIQFHLTDNS